MAYIKTIEKLFRPIWHKPLKSYSRGQMFLIRQLRILALAIKGFYEDRVQLRASALTYYTLLSIVPIIAMAFGIAKGFGFDKFLQKQIHESFAGQETVVNYLLNFVNNYLLKIKGGVVAGIGLVMLIWTIMKLLGNIENSFNHIWQIKKARGMSRKLSDYVSLVVISPILMFVSSGVTYFLTEQIENSAQVFPLLGYIGGFLSAIVALIPYVLIWLVFTLLYLIMPNTKVQLKPAFIGGVVAGTIFQLLQWGYMHFQGWVSGYGLVYGSFAALPLFLMWLQFSWLIVLLGAEIAFAYQNVEHYEAEAQSPNISNHLKRIVSLSVLKEITTNFKNGHPPMSAEELANKLEFPVRLVRDILYELVETGLISETVTQNVKENAYQPAQDIQRMNLVYVLELLDKRGTDNLVGENKKNLTEIMKLVDGLNEENKASKHNQLLHEMK